MLLKWFPWKWMIRRAASNYGIADPFMFLARLRRFAEPSEVDAPLELIRAWTVFQARGIVNTRAIQHNLDWVWPYWVERQFDPRDPSFLPRSFSLSHINLTHRNWMAVSIPNADRYALVDPRGLVTPLPDGWSLDAWLCSGEEELIPSRRKTVNQRLLCEGELAVETTASRGRLSLMARAEMEPGAHGAPAVRLTWRATAPEGARLCIALRPYNPEGVQFIDSIRLLNDSDGAGWRVNHSTRVLFDEPPDRCVSSCYADGDVYHRLDGDAMEREQTCGVGMATAAALFPFAGHISVGVRIPLDAGASAIKPRARRRRAVSWKDLDARTPDLAIPHAEMAYHYRAAVRTLLSLSAGEVFPGSYTYRRFWFRDACLMLHALLTLNHREAVERAFEDSFPRRLSRLGFFESQQGEWDSNGQVLWLAGRYTELTGEVWPEAVLRNLRRGAEWIARKRGGRSRGKPDGLLPAGFSAEHLGPNNYYYWDNFWALAGLRQAAALFDRARDPDYAERLRREADDFEACIEESLADRPGASSRSPIPAAPNRRMDAGAVGSLAADYPLQLYAPGQERMRSTADYLWHHHLLDHGFFHDITHSGINPYLTLHLAQVLLRAGDERFQPLVRRVSALASPAGQWPEAIHPATGGGCMGDGQHGWAAAEWALMIRALFVREEHDRLVIGAGLFPEWLDGDDMLRFGPTATRFGPVTVTVDPSGARPDVRVEGAWRGAPPKLDIAVRGAAEAPEGNPT